MNRKELLKYAQDLGYKGRFIIYMIEEFLVQLGFYVVYYRHRYFVMPNE